MLWAFSTADRADPYFFEILTDRLVSRMEKQTDTPQVIKGGKNFGSTPFETLRIKPQVRHSHHSFHYSGTRKCL